MAITSQPSSGGQELTIVIQGRFDFAAGGQVVFDDQNMGHGN